LEGLQTNATVEAVDYVNLMVLYKTESDLVSSTHPEIQMVIKQLKEEQLAEQANERNCKADAEILRQTSMGGSLGHGKDCGRVHSRRRR